MLLLWCCLITSISFGQAIKVLFVGNSLTYTNNLPELVKLEAKSRGFKVKVSMLAYPNYAIIDHWSDGDVQKMIMNGKYDYVVIQQGPSSQEEGRRMLIEDGATLARLCEKYETQLAYFMVWPSNVYYHTFDKVIQNHKAAAEENNAVLFPVGEVWKKHFDETKDFSYYGMDGFHPSLRGSQVAAKVIVDTLLKDG